MNKKKVILISSLSVGLAVVIALVLLTVFLFVPNAQDKKYYSQFFHSAYEAPYREFYQLPYNSLEGRGVTYTVRFGGREVETFNGGFLVEELGTYSVSARVQGRSAYDFSVVAKDMTAPTLSFARDYGTALVNTQVSFPQPSVLTDNLDSAENIALSYALEKDGAAVEFTGTSFTPSAAGNYTLTATAADAAGNAAQAEYVFNVVSDASKLNKVFYFDESYGTKCFMDFVGGSVSYNTDPQYVREGENGSVRVTFDGSHVNPRLAVNYPLISLADSEERGEFQALVFHVYNASPHAITMVLTRDTSYHGGTFGQTIPANGWAEVRYTRDMLAENPNWDVAAGETPDSIDDPYFDLNDISGLQFFFFTTDGDNIMTEQGGTLYYGAAYAEFTKE